MMLVSYVFTATTCILLLHSKREASEALNVCLCASVCLYLSVCLSVSVCLCLYLSVYLCLCVDRAKTVSRRAVTGSSAARLSSSSLSSHRHRHRHRHLSSAAVTAGDVIDDGDAEMEVDSSSYISVPLDIKPSSWLLASVCCLCFEPGLTSCFWSLPSLVVEEND